MFGRAIRDKMPECNFDKFEIFKNYEGDLCQNIARTKHEITC